MIKEYKDFKDYKEYNEDKDRLMAHSLWQQKDYNDLEYKDDKEPFSMLNSDT